jgi:uncharacterized protein (TIGR02145 family)
MRKTVVIAFFATCLQLPGLKLDSATVKCELSETERLFAAEAIPENSMGYSASAAIEYKPILPRDSVTDTDGHVYHVVKIGKQRWLQENLKASHFSNGEPIGEFENSYDWPDASGAAWCYYERNKGYNYPYGKLYNWYAAADPRNVCPTGWHVPTNEEFQILSDYLGGDDSSGAHMKAIELWNEKNADNTSGFTALPVGIRFARGSFGNGSGGADGADFWTSSPYEGNAALCRVLYHGNKNFSRRNADMHVGLSVRCVGN